MENTYSIDPIPSLLQSELLKRIERNPSYSLRAFARDLNFSHTYLSLLLSGRRKLSPKRIRQFQNLLGLNPHQIESLQRNRVEAYLSQPSLSKKKKQPQYYSIEIDKFKTVSEWYHLALMDLTCLTNFKSDPKWIGKKLGIPVKKVHIALSRLQRLGLIKKNGGKWEKTHLLISIPTHYRSPLRKLHGDLISKAQQALKTPQFGDPKTRDITGTVIPLNVDRLEPAKKKIERFRKQLLKYLSEGDCTELYQLNVQLFPLTKLENH